MRRDFQNRWSSQEANTALGLPPRAQPPSQLTRFFLFLLLPSPGPPGARTMASFLQRVASQGCGGGSFLRHSGRAFLSSYHKGGGSTSCEVDTDEDLHPNWRWGVDCLG